MLTAFQSVANVIDSETILVRGSDLRDNFLQLKDMGLIPAWDSTSLRSSTSLSGSHIEKIKL